MNDNDNYMDDPRAKTVEGFIVALKIFAKYMEKGEKRAFFCGAAHDELFIYADGPLESSEDGVLLTALGFHFDEDAECWRYFT